MMVINSNQPRPILSSFSIWRPVAAILENEKTLGTRLGASLLYPFGRYCHMGYMGSGQGYKSESLGLE